MLGKLISNGGGGVAGRRVVDTGLFLALDLPLLRAVPLRAARARAADDAEGLDEASFVQWHLHAGPLSQADTAALDEDVERSCGESFCAWPRFADTSGELCSRWRRPVRIRGVPGRAPGRIALGTRELRR